MLYVRKFWQRQHHWVQRLYSAIGSKRVLSAHKKVNKRVYTIVSFLLCLVSYRSLHFPVHILMKECPISTIVLYSLLPCNPNTELISRWYLHTHWLLKSHISTCRIFITKPHSTHYSYFLPSITQENVRILVIAHHHIRKAYSAIDATTLHKLPEEVIQPNYYIKQSLQ